MFTVRAKSKEAEESVTLIRPSELPIYNDQDPTDEYEYVERPSGFLEEKVGDVRRAVTDFAMQYKETYEYAQHVVETGKAHSAATLDYLQDETNLVPRATAITVGGLTGLLVAAIRRRGLLKRLMYTGVGLAVPTSICYPQQTAAYGRWAVDESTKYGTIAYNFMVGAKPDGTKEAAPPPAKAAPSQPEPKKAEPKSESKEAAKPKAEVAKPKANEASKPKAEDATKAAPSPPAPTKPKVAAPVVGDPGQANPEDADLYTTRSG